MTSPSEAPRSDEEKIDQEIAKQREKFYENLARVQKAEWEEKDRVALGRLMQSETLLKALAKVLVTTETFQEFLNIDFSMPEVAVVNGASLQAKIIQSHQFAETLFELTIPQED